MKRVLVFLLFVLLFIGVSQKAEAVIIYHNGPTLTKMKDLPSDAVIENKHVNLGIVYDQFGLFWMPLWNYGEVRYVLMDDAEDLFWGLNDETLAQIKNEYNLELEEKPEIPLLSKIGLKPVIAILILYFIWSAVRRKEEEDETYKS